MSGTLFKEVLSTDIQVCLRPLSDQTVRGHSFSSDLETSKNAHPLIRSKIFLSLEVGLIVDMMHVNTTMYDKILFGDQLGVDHSFSTGYRVVPNFYPLIF